MSDLIIVGGGVIGLAIAYELAGEGVAVRLVERGEPGREASWAGAGILTPASTAGARAPIDRLRALSLELTPPWVEAIHEATGLDPGYRRYGALYLAAGDAELEELERAAAGWAAQGVEAEPLTAAAARRLEPALGPGFDRAYLLPGEAQVRNPRLLAALAEACRRRGVTLDTGCEVTGLRVEGRRVTALDTAAGPIPGDRFVLAAGAWTPALAAGAGIELAGEPVRGQLVLLDAPAPPFRHNLWSGERYAVARDDGRVLVGSTMERAGFDKRPTASRRRSGLKAATPTTRPRKSRLSSTPDMLSKDASGAATSARRPASRSAEAGFGPCASFLTVFRASSTSCSRSSCRAYSMIRRTPCAVNSTTSSKRRS
jgi:glycine oxidase